MQIIKKKLYVKSHYIRVCIIAFLVFLCIYFTYYFHIIIKTGEGISHFFYIPIILSVLWWGKKGNIVAVLLALMLISADHLFGIGETKFFDYVRGIMLVAVSYILSHFILTIERSLNKIRKLQNEIMKITTKERQRIGQDLHDGLGQNLTAATFLLEALGEEKDSLLPQIEKIHEIISGAIVQTKNLSRMLCPVELEKEGLVSAIVRMAEATEKIFKVRCNVFSDSNFQVDDEQTAIHLYYIVREAVNNAIRHGAAGKIEINLKSGNGKKYLSVKDNGSGSTGEKKNEGMGLYIMQYRAHIIGADFSAGNHDEGGFMVQVGMN